MEMTFDSLTVNYCTFKISVSPLLKFTSDMASFKG